MKTLPLLTAALLFTATTAFAQDMTPGGHFIENWDLDGNGAVSLAEATEKRGDLFTTFDADENGSLSAEEYKAFDETRAAHQAQQQAEMEKQGMGKGKGKGMMQMMGFGKGNAEEAGMALAFNDTDGNGAVSREEFIGKAPEWFAKMDRNGDGAITTADFGPKS